MGIIKRFLVFIYAAFIAVISLAYLAVASGIVPWSMFEEAALPFIGSLKAILSGVAVFLFSILLIALSFSSKKKEVADEIILGDEKSGKVKVASSVLTALAEKAALEAMGVKEAKAAAKGYADNGQENLAVELEVTIGSDRNAKAISEEVEARVKNSLAAVIGIERNRASVAVKIADVAAAPANSENKKRVV